MARPEEELGPMSPRRYAIFMAAALLLLFFASNALVGALLKGARLDLTEDHLYSLSDGSKKIIADLNEPVDLTLYYSQDAGANYPAIRTYAARVRELLGSYAARSHGQIRVREVDPKRFTDAEDEAAAANMQAVTPERGGDPIYLGLSGANAVDERVAIPYLAPEREAYLEYEITRLVAELQSPRRMKVAVITSLPLDPASASNPASPQPLFFTQLTRTSAITMLPRGFTEVPADTEELVILQPWQLTEAEGYAVDQFMMRKGRAFIAVDPAAVSWAPTGLSFSTTASSANLNPLLTPWSGVAVSRDVVLDRQRALEVETQDTEGHAVVAPQPLYVSTPRDQMSREDLITAGLRRAMYFGAAGAIMWQPSDGVLVTPLVRTTKMTMRLPAERALMGVPPQQLILGFQPSGRVETLAARISGSLKSAFPGGTPVSLAGAWKARHIARSSQPAEIVLVSDIDFLNDAFYVSQRSHAPFVDNGAFALNAIDLLGGSDALVSLRSRAPSLRPLEKIDQMRVAAQEKVAQTEEEVRGQLAATEERLAQLQAHGEGSGFFAGDLNAALTADEQKEVERFQAQVAALRGQLRGVQRDYRQDVDRLEGWLTALNVALAPALVAGGGLFFFIWRRRQRRLKEGGA